MREERLVEHLSGQEKTELKDEQLQHDGHTDGVSGVEPPALQEQLDDCGRSRRDDNDT